MPKGLINIPTEGMTKKSHKMLIFLKRLLSKREIENDIDIYEFEKVSKHVIPIPHNEYVPLPL